MKKFDKKGPKRSGHTDEPRGGGARARSGAGFDRRGAAPAPYERRRPAGGGFEGRAGRKPAGGGGFEPREGRAPARRFAPRTSDEMPPAEGGANDAFRDPYQRAQRPRSAGFTVTLDPDVARVFRGDASVNKALRLVIQMMEVAAPRPRGGATGERQPYRPQGAGGYRGSPEARGFTRKPRFEEDDDE